MLNKYKFKRKVKEITREQCDSYFTEYVEQANIFDLSSLDSFRNEQTSDSTKIGRISKILGSDIVEALQLLVLWDRYNKSEMATEGMDFNIQRNLLNHYNQKNLNAFLESRANCFLTALYLK